MNRLTKYCDWNEILTYKSADEFSNKRHLIHVHVIIWFFLSEQIPELSKYQINTLLNSLQIEKQVSPEEKQYFQNIMQ